MKIKIEKNGKVSFLYEELLGLVGEFQGGVSISRVSDVEPDKEGNWWAQLRVMDKRKLGPFKKRSDAIRAEVSWIETHFI